MKLLRIKIFAAFIIIGGLASMMIFIPFTSYINSSIKDSLEDVIFGTAEQHPSFLNPDSIYAAFDGHDAYWKTVAAIDKIADTHNVSSIYFVDTRQKPYRFLWDSGDLELGYSPQTSREQVMVAYENVAENMRRAIELETRIFSPKPYTDEFGVFVSMFEPVFNEKGAVIGILGADKEVSAVQAAKQRMIFVILIPIGISALAAVFLSLSLSFSLVWPLKEIKKITGELARLQPPESGGPNRARFGNDELGEIARNLRRVGEFLQMARPYILEQTKNENKKQ